MNRIMLKSKIHGATLTGTELDYEGSITVDQDLLEKANILANEQVHVLNLNNGSRLITYTIAAPRGSGDVVLNGPAARFGMAGDRIIILSYLELPDEEATKWRPKIIFLNQDNRLLEK